ncbi:pyridoxamine 5'-phosphate oxidase [SAR92 clade bacterium H455]|uniref:Pyridoxine/pyridoxamine 5'-phosphate oxidase n=1 Tax=SAR92 clade bacterium H455 TaxID=2974818 RepID=A0ABY5TTG0_9GAMM|nr:pyridoxamine 5'-phosphate oxidase [SAR92 clade bacterium H455]
MSLQDNRREYDYGKLTRESLSASPFEQFKLWMEQAIEAGIQDPTAMSVATVSAEGKPWQRMVLLKDFDQRGFVFYTNLGSRKAKEIAVNAQVSLHFPWLQLDRQVIVGGRAERLSTVDVLKYFLSRPKGSQLAAWASKQSSRINSRQALETQFAQIKEKFAEGEIPLPDFWGGFRVVPEEIEFWQGGEMRLHDRFSYSRSEDDSSSWDIARLSP